MKVKSFLPCRLRELKSVRALGWTAAVFVAASLVLSAAPAWAQQGYLKPSKRILEALDAPATPQTSASPTRDAALLVTPLRYPGIAELARPMLRLAGLRIDPANNGLHSQTRYVDLVLKRIADGREKKVLLPTNPRLSFPAWSPDGKRFLFTHQDSTGAKLWIGEAAWGEQGEDRAGMAREFIGVRLNPVLGEPCHWLADNRTLLCRVVPAGRGEPPKEARVPTGPKIQESFGRSAPLPTFEDLLQSAHDEDLFDYYATSQLLLIDTATGKSIPVGKPGNFGTVSLAPDGEHILVARIHRPYSYLVPASSFPRDVEIWNRAGRVVYQVARLPLAESVPIGGVPTGPRNFHWRPTDPATLVWVEALDDGDSKKKVPQRDRVMWLKAPFGAAGSEYNQPAEFIRTEHRFAGLAWGEKGNFAILREFDRNRLWGRAWFLNPANPSEAPRLVWDMSTQDRYRNPGTPLTRVLSSGHSAVQQAGDFIFLSGAGASPEGDLPFLDRFNVKTLKAERLFRCAEKTYETVVALLAADASKFLTRRESPSEPPNYFIRTTAGASSDEPGGDSTVIFTRFADPAPQLRGIQRQLVKYKRADGVDLSFTLFLPGDYKPGERRPGVVWAYPLEFASADVAGQVAGSPNRFTTITGYSHLFFLLEGYVVLDGVSMPVVGDPETVNDTYVEQIVSSARAAIQKATEMGVIDPNRVGVGGHSYGAFMTANLLVHSDLFRAGIARSGAYNRTLTPFGFQSERRTLWEAPGMYVKVSPFLHANKIKAPLLLIHGEADNNSGTFPIQSERMYRAVKGNGGSVRYVTLPHESHGYGARESVEHVLWEMMTWFDKFVKNPGPRTTDADSSANTVPKLH